MNLRVMTGIEMEAAMACRRMKDDTVGIDGGMLGSSPWRRGARGGFAPRQGGTLALMLGIFRNAGSESGLVFEITAVSVEVRASPFFHRAVKTPGRHEEEGAVRTGCHGEGVVADLGDKQALSGAGKRNSRWSWGLVVRRDGVGGRAHAALPSITAAATSAAVTSSSTASGWRCAASHASAAVQSAARWSSSAASPSRSRTRTEPAFGGSVTMNLRAQSTEKVL